MGTLTAEIRRLQHGDHSCLIYSTREEQRAAMVPFFKEGLALGERCLYIADDRTVDEVKAYLSQDGIDVDGALARGAFTILTKRGTYLKDGAFDPEGMVALLGDRVRETMALGFTGLRGSGEMTWALGTEKGCDRAIEFEALLNDFFPGKPFVALCQYNATRFAAPALLDVLRTHQCAILGDHVCPNLYFEPREMVLGHSSDAAKLDWRVAQLKRAREAIDGLETAIRARESFFAVAGHELQTPLAALRLRVEQVKHEVANPDNTRTAHRAVELVVDQLDRVTELANRFVNITELASQRLALNLTPVDLSALVQAVLDTELRAAAKANCHIVADIEDGVTGRWDQLRVKQLLTNLLSNAFKFGQGQSVEVRLRATGESATITVTDKGIGIAPAEQRRVFGPFQRAVSENHYSGFGVGLWMVQQIAEAHGGRVQLRSVLGEGSTFTVTLSRNAG